MQQPPLVLMHCRHSKGVLHGDIKPANFCTGHPALQEADKVSCCSPAMHLGNASTAFRGLAACACAAAQRGAADACILRTWPVRCSTGSKRSCPASEHLHGLCALMAYCSLKGTVHGSQPCC